MNSSEQQNLIESISYGLDKFKRNSRTYNFRCPYCGDSQRSPHKTRGNFYVSNDSYRYHCFNCGVNKSFNEFLQDHFPSAKRSYRLNSFKNHDVHPITTTKQINCNDDIRLPNVSNLPSDHIARAYLENRKLPNIDQVFYAKDFVSWVNKKLKFRKINSDSKTSRIVIPFRREDNSVFGFQGRSIDNVSMHKYVTIMIDENMPHVYGLEKVDKKKLVYVVEGPFDSMFLPNSIAMCGSDIDFNYLRRFNEVVFVLDNEPSNTYNINRMRKIIKNNYKIVIWPKWLLEKDINDMVLNNYDVQNIIESNTYHGLKAKLHLTSFAQ